MIGAIKSAENVKKCRKILWWLSVDNFKKRLGISNSIKSNGLISTVILILKQQIIYDFTSIKNFDYHICQSYYAMDFLKSRGIENYEYLSDYINDDYLNIDEIEKNKGDIVLYNPAKGFEFTEKIINKAENLKFIPLKDLTRKEMKDLLIRSKVYIDFGNHPGKDRIPREAAICGC